MGKARNVGAQATAQNPSYTIQRADVFAPEGTGQEPWKFVSHNFAERDGQIVHSIDGRDRAFIDKDKWPDYVEANDAASYACQKA